MRGIAIDGVTIDRVARNYAECSDGELFVILGSSGYYEISLAQGSAVAKIGCEPGAPIELLVS